MDMTEPKCVTELIHAAHSLGWHRLALKSVPLPVLSDWCRERGWDHIADYLSVGSKDSTPRQVRGYVDHFCSCDDTFRMALELGRPKTDTAVA